MVFTNLGSNTLLGYLAYLYHADDKEYDEGFGPSVTVIVGGEDTTWKRSRNKWNPFEKIRTVPGMENEEDFTVIRDKSKHASYYHTERMYYYLDRDRFKEKYRTIRAKLYITRLQRKGDPIFLLQFIMERLTEEELETQRMKEMSKQSKTKKPSKPSLPPYSSIHSVHGDQNSIHPNLVEHYAHLDNYDKNNRIHTYPPMCPSPPKNTNNGPQNEVVMTNNNISLLSPQNILRPLAIKPAQSPNIPPIQSFGHHLPPITQLPFQHIPPYQQMGSSPFQQQQFFNPTQNFSQFMSQPFSTTPSSSYQYSFKFSDSTPSYNKTRAHNKTRSMDTEPPGRWRRDFNFNDLSHEFMPLTERPQKRSYGVSSVDERSAKRKSMDMDSLEMMGVENLADKHHLDMQFTLNSQKM